MTVVTLRADGTTFANGTVVGAATHHEAVADDSDSSYVHSLTHDLELSFPTPSLPAGAIPSRYGLRLRCAETTGLTAERSASKLEVSVLIFDGLAAVSNSGTIRPAWISPTTVSVFAVAEPALVGMNLDDLRFLVMSGGNLPSERLYEVYIDLTYVAKPVATVTAPAGTVSSTNVPAVQWTRTLDSDGGAQTHYEVKIFDDSAYTAPGFNPDTSAVVIGSGDVASSLPDWQPDETIPDGNYRAYVRVAQTVNGARHWSDWAYSEFTIAVALPAAPNVTPIADAPNGRMIVELGKFAGDATTDLFELQRSYDGGATWLPVRTTLGDGRLEVPDNVGSVNGYDYEAPNGAAVIYRARSLHDYNGEYAASAWTQQSGSWSSRSQWLKYPGDLDLPVASTSYGSAMTYGGMGLYGGDLPHLAIRVHAFPAHQRAARQTVMHPLGRSDVVVVSDSRAPAAGTVVLLVDSDADRDHLDALIDSGSPLLLQMADGDERPDRWVRFGDHSRAPVVDKAFIASTLETLAWVEVARPE